MKKMIRNITAIIIAFLMMFGGAPLMLGAGAVWDGAVASGFAGGDGTEEIPYLIGTAAQLAFLSSSVKSGTSYEEKFIRLTEDIVLNLADVFTTDGNGNITGKADGKTPNAWTPIGTGSSAFKGTFDGGDHSVSGIYINTTNSYQGLFGFVSGGTVENMSVEGSYIKGGSYVGGVAGYNTGIVSGCHNSGSVTGISQYTGGITGFNPGTVSNCNNSGSVTGYRHVGGVTGYNTGVVVDCTNTGSVTGSSYRIGGIAGYSCNDGVLSNCSNTGNVAGSDYVGGVTGYNDESNVSDCVNAGGVTGGNQVGGVVGENDLGAVSGSCSTGSTKGTEYVGGVVGLNISGSIGGCYNTGIVKGSNSVGGVTGFSRGTITDCYNIGSVTGSDPTGRSWSSFIGGVAGDYYGTVARCYYLSGTADGGIDSADKPGQAEALTDAEMKDSSSFKGWDFHNVWAIDSANGYEYPQYMKKLNKSLGEVSAVWDGAALSGFASGSGTESDPYLIETAGQLAYLAQTVNSGVTYSGKYIRLVNDINFNEYDAKHWILNASKWTPIGNQSNGFCGTFDGGGNTVSGLYIDTVNSCQGLFGYVSGTVKNIGVTDFYIKGDNYVGSVTGYSGGNVINCYNKGNVVGFKYIGGVTGYSKGVVSGCYNTGGVTGTQYVGGVAGQNAGVITNSYSTGSVTGFYAVGGAAGYNEKSIWCFYNNGYIMGVNIIGGVTGYNSGTVISSHNIGSATGAQYVAGVAGYNSGAVSNSYNTGNVTGTFSNIGGVAGMNFSGTISGCHNTGIVEGSSYVAGVTGGNYYGSTVSDCNNTGSVEGQNGVGGISGSNSGSTLSNCYNTGSVKGPSDAGGVTGYNGGIITGCYNTGGVTGSSFTGGVAGRTYGDVSNCYNTGRVIGGSYTGGVAGTNGRSAGGSATVSKCYNTGRVTGSESRYVGGITGWNYDGATVGGCYYLFGQTLGGINGVDAAGWAEALTDDQMKLQASFVGWDFTDVWTMAGDAGYPYPELRAISTTGGADESAVAGVTLLEESLLLNIGDTAQLTAIVEPTDAPDTSVMWSSGNTNVATVNESGFVTAVAPGRTTITVTTDDGGYKDICTITVLDTVSAWQTGDIGSFGSYPQTLVTDSEKLTALNALTLNWVSYGYYSGTGGWNTPTAKDYMQYADVTYKGDRYRAVKFTSYRPFITYYSSSDTNSSQDENGYITNTVYWFKYEPIKWRVLDASTGLVMAENIVDSKDYHITTPYPTWSGSNIRAWLNGTFYNTAFTSTEQSRIGDSTVSTPAYYNNTSIFSTTDKLYLLARDEVTTAAYGFNVSGMMFDPARMAQGSDYAKCQGLQVGVSAEEKGNSGWWLRSPGYAASDATYIGNGGDIYSGDNVARTDLGIRPAFKLSDLAYLSPVTTADTSAAGVCLNKGNLKLVEGVTAQLTTTVAPSWAADKSVAWSSDNADVATVSQTGLVIAVAPGTATITVTTNDGGFTDSCEVTITPAILSSVEVMSKPLKIKYSIGDTLDTTGLLLIAKYNSGMTQLITSGFDCTPTVLNEAGTQTITVTYGEKTCTFEVTVSRISAAGFNTEEIPNQAYTGSAIKPTVIVTYDGAALTRDIDYSVTYSNNINAGTATVTITGMGNFTGTKAVTFIINPADASLVAAEEIPNQTYTGSAITPSVIVKFNSETLTPNTDYTVTYTSNTNVGTATATIAGRGNFTGTKTVTFGISPADVSAFAIAPIPNQVYTGRAITPSISVKFNEKTLIPNTDYTVAYTNNTNAGMATVTVTGIGNFTGTKTATFEIVTIPLNGITLSAETLELQYGGYGRLSVTFNPTDATNKTITWTSSNPTVATVDSSGNVTARGSGTATITATTEDGDHTASCIVIVKTVWWQWLIKILMFGWLWY